VDKVLGAGGFKNQIIIMILVIVGVFVYRGLGDPVGPSGDERSARLQEIRSFWHRVESYPGVSKTEAEEMAGSDYIVSERLYITNTPYAGAVAFYDQRLPSIGWEAIGEQKDWPGHISPIRIYRHRSYHLLVNKTQKGILLRITWSVNLDPMADIRLIPD
jgi:hypothetical protein